MRTIILSCIVVTFVACSTADEKMRRRDTEKLFYDLIGDSDSYKIGVFNTIQQGFEAVRDHSNVSNHLHELLRREDTGRKLLIILQNVNLEKIGEYADSGHVYCWLQVILSQPEVINNMTYTDIMNYICIQLQCQNTLKILSESGKNDYPHSLMSIFFGLGNVMLKYEFEPFIRLLEMNQDCRELMISGGMVRNETIVFLFNECIYKFINEIKNEEDIFCSNIDMFYLF